MRVSNQNNSIAFKQRYFVPYNDIFQGTEMLAKLQQVPNTWRQWYDFIHLPELGKALVSTAAENDKAMLRSIPQAEDEKSRAEAIQRFLQGAVEFGELQLAELRKVIDPNYDYKVKVTDVGSKYGKKNLDVLSYLAFLGDWRRKTLDTNPVHVLKHKITSDMGVGIVIDKKIAGTHDIVLVKSIDEVPAEMQAASEKQGITIGELNEIKKKLMIRLVRSKTTKRFGSEEAVKALNKVREIMHLPPIKLEDYLSNTDMLRLKD